MTPSLPPAIMTSAMPFWMRRNESPIAWVPVAHAVQTAEFGPFAPVRMETCPEARLTIIPGIRNGLTRSGPFSRRIWCWRSKRFIPPIPEPM